MPATIASTPARSAGWTPARRSGCAATTRGCGDHLAARLEALNASAGSAAQVTRLLLLAEPPSIDAGDITDKGYVNQRLVNRTAKLVERLFAEPPGADVITVRT